MKIRKYFKAKFDSADVLGLIIGIPLLAYFSLNLGGILLSDKYSPPPKFNIPSPTYFSTPTPTPTVIPYQPTQQSAPVQNNSNNNPWGIAKQISEHTWTIRIGNDGRMATPQEIYDALNVYRQRNGSRHLDWSGELATYAQSRAEFFNKSGNLDEHKGFQEYANNLSNLKKLGFWVVGENSSIGYNALGVHLIEWVYAADKPHDDNQKNPNWTTVGIGVSGTATDLVFGSNGM